MNCKKCGSPLVENDQFCKSCGAAVNEVNAQTNVESNTNNSFTQNEFNSGVSGVQQPMNNGMNPQPMQGQPMYSQQPMNSYNNSYNSQPMYNQPQKSNNTKFILIGIGVAVLVVVIALIFTLGKDDSNSGLSGGSTGGDNNVVNTSSTYKVKFSGFTFKIPTDLIYEVESGAILVGDEGGTWAAYIEVVEGSYAQMLSNKSQLQSVYQSMGYTSSAAVEKTYGGVPFITLEISMSGTNALLGLAKANSMNMFGITAYNIDNEYDYDLLQTMASILSSAEYDSETANMSTFGKVDMSGIPELAK